MAESKKEMSEKYSVKMNVICDKNLIFSKYDVMVYVDDIELEKVDHGGERSFDLSLTEGEHIVRFVSVKDDSVDGTIELNVTGDMEITYKLSCNKDQVEVSTAAREEKLEDGRCAVPGSASDFKAEQYTDVVKQLKKAGFTNISTEKIEDLIAGILTSDGEVESVTIDGETDYIKGNDFPSDAEIVIKYHTFPEKSETVSSEEESSNESSVSETSGKSEESGKKESSKEEVKSETAESEYELAFVRKLNGYDLYYMFDTDNNKCIDFGTNDTGYLSMPYTGDINDTIDINYEEYQEGAHLKFKYLGGNKAVMIDQNNIEWEYEKCSVSDAENILKQIT